jgi:localization factor PodJL
VKAALEAKNGPRKQHPGLSYEPLAGQGTEIPPAPASPFAERPSFDPNAVERPPRPTSAFETPAREAFVEASAPQPVAAAAPAPLPEPLVEEPTPSANTFIAAARRAAQRQAKPDKKPGAATSSGSGSLIARAFSSFQLGAKPKAVDEATSATAEKPAPSEKAKKDKKARLLAGDKEPRTQWTADEEDESQGRVHKVQPLPPPPLPRAASTAPEILPTDQEATTPEDEAKESFLSRHRRPILLAASVVAIAFLTLNLISQRLSEGDPAPAADATPATDSSAAPANVSSLDASAAPSPLINESMAKVPGIATAPRVIPMVDSFATASIDPGAAKGFTPSNEALDMPAAFAPVAGDASAPEATMTPATEAIDDVQTSSLPEDDEATPLIDTVTEPEGLASPVQVEMPPEALGPEPLRAAAAGGDARAQFEIAAIYTEGRAVTEDDAQAAIWYERAAAQGFAPAQYRLGNLYENGRGVAKDLTQAKLWYQRAAEAGNRMAMHNLAALYAGGELGKQEFDSAAEWFKQAAERGMRDSQFNLGMLYARGLGVTQSLDESFKWFSLAAQKGDADAAKARDDIARSLDAAAVARLNDEVAAFKTAPVDLMANFAPLGTWSDKFDPGETITNRDVVKSVQQALSGLGYEVGTPDGLAGPRTAEAIKDFEKATGMSEVGAVNPRLLAVLGSQPV